MPDFETDNLFTQRARALIERDLYPRLAYNNHYVSISGISGGSGFLQRQGHIDAVLQTGPGVSVTVEEKIVRNKYDRFAIETHSNHERGNPDGWIHVSTADMLIYAFGIPHGLECWIMSLPALRQWFIPREERYRYHDIRNVYRGNVYHTRVRVVPIQDVSIAKSQYTLTW
jgi:hypothetical protein